MEDSKVYLDYYCKNCKLGLKVVVICGIITCPCCKKIVYAKGEKLG